MSAVNYDAILFTDGQPTYLLLSEWRNRDPRIPLQVVPVLTEDRRPTVAFRGIWRAAFPDRKALPDEPLSDEAGRGTQAFWDAVR
jgi:hypothetical protein